jgi:hypothetical protein
MAVPLRAEIIFFFFFHSTQIVADTQEITHDVLDEEMGVWGVSHPCCEGESSNVLSS